MLSNRERVALDRYITGNFGEDQFAGMDDLEPDGEGRDLGDLVEARAVVERKTAEDLDADRLWGPDPGEMEEIIREAWDDFDRY